MRKFLLQGFLGVHVHLSKFWGGACLFVEML